MFKIRANNPKESAKIQRILFKLGFSWGWNKTKVSFTNKVGLFFDDDKDYSNKSITYTDDLNYFKKHENKEVTFTKLKSKAFQIYLKRLMILRELEK